MFTTTPLNTHINHSWFAEQNCGWIDGLLFSFDDANVELYVKLPTHNAARERTNLAGFQSTERLCHNAIEGSPSSNVDHRLINSWNRNKTFYQNQNSEQKAVIALRAVRWWVGERVLVGGAWLAAARVLCPLAGCQVPKETNRTRSSAEVTWIGWVWVWVGWID